MLLRVLLTDLKPYSKETEEEYAAQRGIGRMMYILLTSHPPIRPLDELVGIYLEGDVADPPSRATLGLFHRRLRDGDDVYFSRSDDHVVRLIRCNPIKPNRGTICEHRFRYKGHDVTLDYGREYLPDWRSIQEAAQQLLTGFMTVPQR